MTLKFVTALLLVAVLVERSAACRDKTAKLGHSSTTKNVKKTRLTCSEWSDWSRCNSPCGKSGRRDRTLTCTDRKGEEITRYQYQRCFIRCLAVKRYPTVGEAFCSSGRLLSAHPGNCHLYFICARVHHTKFRMHGLDCGNLFWNENKQVCDNRSPKPNTVMCKDVEIRPHYPPKIESTNCEGDNLLLQVDFESGFVDSCQGEVLEQKGADPVKLEKERGNTAACFNGSSFMQIPFLKQWFTGKTVKEFSVALWYKRCAGDNRPEQGIIHNGGCGSTDSGFQITAGHGGLFAGVTSTRPFPSGLKQVFAVMRPMSKSLEDAEWQHAVMVFDGQTIRLYIQGYERERAPSEGDMLHADTDAFLGKLCGGKFFCGCIDNLRIWNRILPPGEILYLQNH